MLSHPTLHALHNLKLLGMAAALEQQLQQPDFQALSFDERLGLLVDREVLSRDNRRLARLLQTAKLKVHACVEDIDYRHPRGLKRAQIPPSSPASGSERTTISVSPALREPEKRGWHVPLATWPVAWASPCAICASPGSLHSYGLRMGMAAICAGSNSGPKPISSSSMIGAWIL